MPDFCLSLDVMAGFPGEEEKHFQNTVDLLKAVQPLKCHVFPYSRREGTKAAQYIDVAPAEIKQRVKRLIQMGDEISLNVRRPYLGKTLPVLAETFKEGSLQGLTPNYLKVIFPGFEEQRGQIIPVKLLSLTEDGFRGAIE
jgi:threonylcarbamoyladenosine tRNA methylthiotransferase MtaB